MISTPESDPYLAVVDVDHPLSEALHDLGLKLDPSFPIASLKPQKEADTKSAIYHVGIQGMSDTSLVAKRSRVSSAMVERRVYEDILPHLSLPSPRYYGFTHEQSGAYGWQFLEYIPGVPLTREDASHRRAAAQWLGRFHTATASMPSARCLPDGGSDRYLGHLRSARSVLGHLHDQSEFAGMRDALGRLIDILDQLQARWESIAASCDVMPRALVHGDFVPKNIRVVGRGEKIALYPFDWETAGFGVPVADLSTIDIASYVDEASHLWTGFSVADVRQCAFAGRVFRYLASVDWSCSSLRWEWSTRAAHELTLHGAGLEQTLHQLDLAGMPA